MIERVENPGAEAFSPARKFGELLKARLEKDPTFFVFSPDETTSNKLDEVFQASARLWTKSAKRSKTSSTDLDRSVFIRQNW